MLIRGIIVGKSEYVDDGDEKAEDDDEGVVVEGKDGSDSAGEEYIAPKEKQTRAHPNVGGHDK